MTCWICEEYEECPYPVCYEQEVTEIIKREKESQIDLFEGDESEPINTEAKPSA